MNIFRILERLLRGVGNMSLSNSKKKKAKRKAITISIADSRHHHDLKRRECIYRPFGVIDTSSPAWIEATKNAVSLDEIEEALLPRNIKHLLEAKNSPFNREYLPSNAFTAERTLVVPRVFSIIKNERESYPFLKDLISTLIHQDCNKVVMDYSGCVDCDLLTQVVLDSILIDYKSFVQKCKSAGKIGRICISDFGAKNYDDIHIQRMINSVGSPVELKIRKMEYDEVIPFNLLRFDAKNATYEKRLTRKGIDSTRCLEYVNSCLERMNKTLTRDALKELGYVVGETIINAEEHSSLKYRYMVGYFEESHDKANHYGYLNLVIMNYGKTIYEKFKYPSSDEPVNLVCLQQMKDLSVQFENKRFFSKNSTTEENLWTLYSLQQGVTCIPDKERGNGTIEFIDSFFKLKGSNSVDDESRMYILSGNTVIEFDGKYRVSSKAEANGKPRVIAFNDSGSLNEKPDSRYVRNSSQYFPGTAIFVRLLLNEDDIQQQNKQ